MESTRESGWQESEHQAELRPGPAESGRQAAGRQVRRGAVVAGSSVEAGSARGGRWSSAELIKANRMADVFSKAKRSQVMAAIRSKGNKDTEVCLARILRVGGISGWRRHVALPGRPDFVFQKDRVAVFVDGCFWHGCPQHGRKPDSNKRYWNAKIARNKARDRAVTLALKSAGWRVVRIWEHGLKLRNSVTRRVAAALTKRNLEDYR